MEKKESMLVHVSKGLVEMEGAPKATGISTSGRTGGLADLSVVPDPEVPEKAVRRRFTAELTPLSALRHVLDVNVIGVFAVTQAFLPLLRKSRGRVINNGSVSGLTALPGMSVYAASKYAIEAITESLRVELRPFGISVSVIEPGVIATEIWEKGTAKVKELILNADPDVFKLYAPLALSYQNSMEKQKYLPPEAVADRVYHAFTAPKPKYHYLVGSDAKFLAFTERLPGRIRDWIVYKTIYKGSPKK